MSNLDRERPPGISRRQLFGIFRKETQEPSPYKNMRSMNVYKRVKSAFSGTPTAELSQMMRVSRRVALALDKGIPLEAIGPEYVKTALGFFVGLAQHNHQSLTAESLELGRKRLDLPRYLGSKTET